MKMGEAVKRALSPGALVVVASADRLGVPHLATARGAAVSDDERIAFSDWFCFRTLENVAENPRVAVALLDLEGDRGVQLLGTVEQYVAKEFLDGYLPGEGKKGLMPQARHELRIRVERILELTSGPHSDEG
jgi:hypothetical protein